MRYAVTCPNFGDYADARSVAALARDPWRDGSIVAEYADAGLTWWFEGIDGWRGSFEEMQALVRGGPPRA